METMVKFFHFLLLVGAIHESCSKLVLEKEEDLFLENGEIDKKLIEEKAEFVEQTEERKDGCEYITEITDTYKIYFKAENNEEKEEFVALGTYLEHVANSQVEMQNMDTGNTDAVEVSVRMYLACYKADDPKLIEEMKKHVLHAPTKNPYNLDKKMITGQHGQGLILNTVIFKEKVRNGFFIEIGAGDFESTSNTVLLEVKENWEGILVEPNTIEYRNGLQTERKVWSANAGITAKDHPEVKGILNIPLYSFILAADRKINYMSLFLPQDGVDAIKAVPWDKVDVEVISIDNFYLEEVNEGTNEQIRSFLKEQGYVLEDNLLKHEDVYIRKDLYEGDYAPDKTMWEVLKRMDPEKLANEDLKDLKKDNLFSYINWKMEL